MIEIIAGSASLIDGKTRKVMTPADGPFNAAPDIEARWVRQGIARYVTDAPQGVPDEASDAVPYEETEEVSDEASEDYGTWSAEELKAELKARGIKADGRSSKAKLIELLVESDTLPTFDALEVE